MAAILNGIIVISFNVIKMIKINKKTYFIAGLIFISIFWATQPKAGEPGKAGAKIAALPVLKMGLNVASFNTLDPHQLLQVTEFWQIWSSMV